MSAGTFHSCALRADGVVECWGNNANGQAPATRTATPVTTIVLPTAAFSAPSTAVATQPFVLTLANPQVPGHPEATTFTYAFDCGTGTYGAATSSASASCTPAAAGPLTVRGKVIDQDGDTASYAASVTVSKATQTVAFTSVVPSPAYVGTPYTATAAATSGLAAALASLTPATCTVPAGATATAAVSFVAAGACTLAADQAGNATYAPATQATQTITVALRPQAIAFTSTPPSPARVGATYAVAATGGASGNTVVFSSLTPATCAVSGSTVSFVAGGACTVAANQAGSATYAPATQATQAVTVVASFPATPVLDAFSRADGALGANWGGFAAPLFFRVSQQHGAVGLGGGIGWAPNAFGTAQEAFVMLTRLDAAGRASAQGLVLKGQDPANHTLGAITVTYDPQAGVVRVAALRAPPAAGTAYPALAVAFAAGDQLGARATAAGTVEVYRNGALVRHGHARRGRPGVLRRARRLHRPRRRRRERRHLRRLRRRLRDTVAPRRAPRSGITGRGARAAPGRA
ncbi:hypothetical protein tb265_29790 [Gemmatimonadetes bacterium T265]|nr:hypothetical protein tb265_29790 [Gemmatimonadetes bacterium T265]